METWFPILVVVFMLTVAGYLVAGWWRTRTQTGTAEAEAITEGTTFYTQTGGARLDSFNATIPFASIVVTPSRITLIVFGRQHRFKKSSVRSLSRHHRFISTGLRIEHSGSEAPAFVVFWTTNFAKLASALERFDWVVGR